MTSRPPSTENVAIENVETLSDNWYVLRKYTFRYRRRDGSEQRLSREAYDRGNGAAILLYNREKNSLILTRQFRLPAFVNGLDDGMLLEVPAGLLDDDDPASAIRREAEEETGFRVRDVIPVFTAYTSPGSVTEQLHFFAAEYADRDRVGAGGGHAGEGEDIEVIEVGFDEAMAMIERGEIVDLKTIALIYHAAIKGLLGNS
ncbi:NUDIX domain-containing protein [Stappia sp. GBMRC 2046]|uniref:GDP-mannose pyrophosphatase n=1 Tax=Stappia sediminis TaxID=2692190 RepID=A0A7X3LW54_9HYPH|nr:NUDIX domain-containing protein [Stappia sediminis]MXN66207.1 NUDIX domain-containing protein [Stappia sediminis]